MKQSSKCAIGGIVAALSLVIMISVAVIPFMTYALPAIAGIFIVLIVIEIDKKWAFGVYAAVAILGVLLVPDKEVAAMYLAFFGYYPILKAVFESRLNVVLSWAAKIALFLATISGSYWLLINLMGLEIDEMEEWGKMAVPILLGMGTFAFIIYDIMLGRMVVLYNARLRKYFHKYFK